MLIAHDLGTTGDKASLHEDDGTMVFDYRAKSGQRRVQSIRDPAVRVAIEEMRRRRSGPEDLLVFREDGAWRDVR